MARAAHTFGDVRISPRNQRLLKWLRRKPVPHSVIGECADGEERRAIVSATGPATWADVLSVVRPCVHLEALDADGNTLRALDLDSEDPELRAESELERAEQVARAVPGSVPIISVDLPRLIDNLARNMREVGSEAARQQAAAHREGFSAMVSVVNLCLGLLVRLEQRMARYDDERDQRDGADGSPAPQLPQRDQLALMAIQRALGSSSNGAASGAGGLDLGALLRMVQQQPTDGDQQ